MSCLERRQCLSEISNEVIEIEHSLNVGEFIIFNGLECISQFNVTVADANFQSCASFSDRHLKFAKNASLHCPRRFVMILLAWMTRVVNTSYL